MCTQTHTHTHTHTHFLCDWRELKNLKCLDETVTSAIKIWIICWMWACVCLSVCARWLSVCIFGSMTVNGNIHRHGTTHTSVDSEFPGDRGLSLLLFTAEGCRIYKATQCRGLMDQRPADLESCSEYWSPPNTDGGKCVCVCVWGRDTVRGKEEPDMHVASFLVCSVTKNATEGDKKGARVCMSQYTTHSVAAILDDFSSWR